MWQKINKVVRILVIADFFIIGSWALVTPILAIFVINNIQGGDVKVAGIAIGIYWLSKSFIQIPIAYFLDKTKGEKDDYYALLLGIIISSTAALFFIYASLPWHIYIIEGMYAFGMAMVIPSWCGIFSRHIEKGKEAFCWSLDSSALGIGGGIAGIVGGIIAKKFGFTPLFIGVFILGLISAFLILLVAKNLLPKERIFSIPKF